MNKIKLFIILFALCYLTGANVGFLDCFYSAYFSDLKITVFVDKYNEANFEFVLFTIGTILSLYAFKLIFDLVKEDWNERDEDDN